MLTDPLAASASGIGPIELLMIRGPAAMTIGRYQMFSGSPMTAPLMIGALIEVARPDRIDLAIEDGQPHLVAVTERRRPSGASPADWLSACGPRTSVWPVIASIAVSGGLA